MVRNLLDVWMRPTKVEFQKELLLWPCTLTRSTVITALQLPSNALAHQASPRYGVIRTMIAVHARGMTGHGMPYMSAA